jgi:uncharacterized protein
MPTKLKIILDVNIWLSALISKTMAQQIKAIILQDTIEVIACDELIAELKQTLERDKFRKYLAFENIPSAIELVEHSTTEFKISSTVEYCRDNKDDYLLALSIDSQADFLITGDKDLLVLQKFNATKIVRLTEFIKFIS